MKPAYAKPENANYLGFILIFFFLSIILITILIFASQENPIVDNTCDKQLTAFDSFVVKSKLPVIEDSDSLCHGLTISTDFSKLEPKWAVGKFIGINLDYKYGLIFEGKDTTEVINVPLQEHEVKDLKLEHYYKVDMNNICRNNLMLVDSKYPSTISETFIRPIETNCGKINL